MTITTSPDRSAVADLVRQLGSGFGRPLQGRSPSARRVALSVGRPRPAATPSPDQLGLSTITEIVTGLAAAEALWRPHVDHDRMSRTSVRLVATPVYEVWLLGWSPGQRVELHDHGGANAAFVVVEGALDEVTLTRDGLHDQHLATGEVGTVPSGAVHDVVNRGSVDATSLHVYADPLRTMTFYDDRGTPTFTELVEEVPALLRSGPVGAALHPARSR